MDICRNLPENAKVECHATEKGTFIVRSGNSRFTLLTLPSDDFPKVEPSSGSLELTLPEKDLLFLIQRTAFAMAQQDVRYYLNGMLFEAKDGNIKTVATNGHRLAMNTVAVPAVDQAGVKIIIPRKGILELIRLLSAEEHTVKILINANHIHVHGSNFTFTSKLIDGNFPDYNRVIPNNCDKSIIIDKNHLKQSITRATILSHEKVRGVCFQLRQNLLRLFANNPEQEEAEEDIRIDYLQEDLDIGFNATYLLDVLNTIESSKVKFSFSNPNNSTLIEEEPNDSGSLFVVMPMCL